MKCRRARGLIYDFIDGIIDDRNRVALEQHLGECKSCEGLARGLSASLDLLHRTAPVQPDDNFTWKVRLRLARERNALVDPAVSERSWARSWNRRFAVSALSAFLVVVGATYLVTKSSLLPTGREPLSRLLQSPQERQVPAEPKVAEKVERPSGPAVLASGNAGPLVVSTDQPAGRSRAGTGALEGDAGPPLDLDSLLSQYVNSAVARHRVRGLRDQVDLLTEKLRECGVRCGEKHDHGDRNN